MALILSDTALLAHLESIATYNANANRDAWVENHQLSYYRGSDVADEARVANVWCMQRQLFARSERVKGIDFHPTEPWILTTLYSGHVYIWSYETQVCAPLFLCAATYFLGSLRAGLGVIALDLVLDLDWDFDLGGRGYGIAV